jgi:hypothetical protein
MAAWLTGHGGEFKGGRELLEVGTWSGEISWQDHRVSTTSSTAPTWSVSASTADRSQSRWSWRRSRSSASEGSCSGMRVWRHAGKSNGFYYVCGDEDGRTRIRKAANTGRAFRYDDRGLTLLLLDTIKEQAIEMREADADSGRRPPPRRRLKRIAIDAQRTAQPSRAISCRGVRTSTLRRSGSSASRSSSPLTSTSAPAITLSATKVVVIRIPADARRVGRVSEHHDLRRNVGP